MKKNRVLSLLFIITLIPCALVKASQGGVEERQPTFAEALQFFKQQAQEKSVMPATRQEVDLFKPKETAVATREEQDDTASSLQAQVNRLEMENKRLMQDISSLTQQYEQLQSEHEARATQLREEQEKNIQLRDQISQAAQSNGEVIANQLAEATQEIAKLQETVADLTQERDQSIQAAQEKDAQILALQEQVTQQTIAPAMLPAALPPAAPAQQAERPQPTEALQKHLAAIRAGAKLKPAEKRELKAKPEQTGILGTIASGLQSRFGWMWGEEEPEDQWDNQLEEQIQTP